MVDRSSEEAEAKGTNFTAALRVLRQVQGAAIHDRVVAEIPGPAGEALRLGQLLPVGWYPVSWYRDLLHTIQSITGGGLALTHQLAARGTEQDFTGLHRTLVRMLSTQTAARHAHRLFQLYWRGGEVVVADERPGLVLVRFTGWRGFEAAIWEDIAGSIEGVLGVVGAGAPRARVIAITADRSGADLEARFSA